MAKDPTTEYMTNRRRDQEEAWNAGADAMLDMMMKAAQRHIDKAAQGSLPVIAKTLHELASYQYRSGTKVFYENPFLLARTFGTKAPELPVLNIKPPVTEREPGTAEREPGQEG